MEKSLARAIRRPARAWLFAALAMVLGLASTVPGTPTAAERSGSAVGQGTGRAGAAATERLPFAVDLRAEIAAAAARGQVYVVLYGTSHCPFCTKVRRNYLIPLTRNPDFMRTTVLREIDPEARDALIDATGERTDHAGFARRQGVKFVPVVAFLGPGGQSLAEPIVGISSEDFYGAYLDARLGEAREKLAKLRAGGP